VHVIYDLLSSVELQGRPEDIVLPKLVYLPFTLMVIF